VSAMSCFATLCVAATSISAKTNANHSGACWISCQNMAGAATCSFTSTDTLWVVMNGAASSEIPPGNSGHTLVVRYKDK
jgi:hypothetical protein